MYLVYLNDLDVAAELLALLRVPPLLETHSLYFLIALSHNGGNNKHDDERIDYGHFLSFVFQIAIYLCLLLNGLMMSDQLA